MTETLMTETLVFGPDPGAGTLTIFEAGVFAVGATAALLMIAALYASHVREDWRIWPAPPAGSWASIAVWSGFRTVNVAVLTLAAWALLRQGNDGTLHGFQVVVTAAALLVFAIYLYALWALGRDATYCKASGLATDGIYRWTRNPQYAAAIAAFGLLGAAAAEPAATGLTAALVIMYALMAIVEEPWLAARYGTAYQNYRAKVPRFFNWALLRAELVAAATGSRQRRAVRTSKPSAQHGDLTAPSRRN
jgi:protein-S-isoprenylcysteine O-methyltransferase Ste14